MAANFSAKEPAIHGGSMPSKIDARQFQDIVRLMTISYSRYARI